MPNLSYTMQNDQEAGAFRPFLNIDSNIILVSETEPRADSLVRTVNSIPGLHLGSFTTNDGLTLIAFKDDRMTLGALNELYSGLKDRDSELTGDTYLTSQVDTEGGMIGATRPFGDVTLNSVIGLEFPIEVADSLTIKEGYNTLIINKVKSTPFESASFTSEIALSFRNDRVILTDNNNESIPSKHDGERVDNLLAEKLGLSVDNFVFTSTVEGKFTDG